MFCFLFPCKKKVYLINIILLIVDFCLRQVLIPEKGTTYWCQIFKLPTLTKKHHVIKVSNAPSLFPDC